MRWKASFENVLVLDYKQLMSNPKGSMKDVASFLGVPNDFQTSSNQIFNQSGNPTFTWINKLLKRKTWAHQLLALVMPQEKRVLIKNKILNKNNQKASLQNHPAFSEWLSKVYETDILLYENLSKQTD